MRLWHVSAAVVALAFVLTLGRDPTSRVFLILFATGLGESALALAAVMALFQTVGAFGAATSLPDHAEAVAATTVVLAVATAAMSAWMFAGFWLVAATT
jgi:hypothetical protein